MKTRKFISNAMQAAFFGFSLFAMASCTDTPSSPSQSGSVVVMRTELDNSIVRPFSATTQSSSRVLGTSVDSLQVTSAAFVASGFMLRSDLSDGADGEIFTEEAIRNEQFLLSFDGGREYIGERIILAGTYLRARFNIQTLQGRDDSLESAMGPIYTSLFSGNGTQASDNTIVVHGYVWKDGNKMPFSFSSKAARVGSIIFDQPLVVTAGSDKTEVLVRFKSAEAFSTGEGLLMDPRDARNGLGIESNLKHSLKAEMTSGS